MRPTDDNLTPDDDTVATAPTYERPLITDQGSLTDLTLATGGSYTDGTGMGGGGS